jgi:hypothetical protein
MHTLMVLAIGFVLFGCCAIAGRFVDGTAGIAASGLVFLPLWFIGAASNMYLGAKKAGYSVADEAPLFLLVFSIPAAAALFTWWQLR